MSDEHLVALQGIWNEMKTLNGRVNETNRRLETGFSDVNLRLDKTNERLDQTNERLDRTNERLDQTNERLDRVEHAQSSSEIRMLTELVALHQTVGTIRDIVKGAFEDDRLRLAKLERRVDALERKRDPE